MRSIFIQIRIFALLLSANFLATGAVSAQGVFVNSPAALEGSYAFSPTDGWGADLATDSWTGDAEVVNDGSANPSEGCNALSNSLAGKIALIDRGRCTFTSKSLNAQMAGAIAVIIFNNQPGAGTILMGAGVEGPQVTIPVVMLSYEDGQVIRAALANGPVNITIGTLIDDSDDDGIADDDDNCPNDANPGQEDADNDDIGDACDTCQGNDATGDFDNDGLCNDTDPDDDDDGQSDADELACGSNPLDAASLSPDNDGDNSPDCVDPDDDNDGVADNNDNCPTDANANQADFDLDGIGDACDPEVCFNFVADGLQNYVDGLSISSSIKRAINRRLGLAVTKFCDYNRVSSVVADLEYLVSYVSYQSGGRIPAGDADYIITQVNGLIDALNNGTAVCCTPPAPRPANPGQITATDALQLQANPNPFRDEVTIRFRLPQAGPATLEVFNLNGQRVAALHAGYLDAGYQDFRWNGADGSGRQLSSGIYLVRLQTEEGMLTQKVSLVR